jgi:hypothetical protein
MSEPMVKEMTVQTQEDSHEAMIVPFEKIKSELKDIIIKMTAAEGGGEAGKTKGGGNHGRKFKLATA